MSSLRLALKQSLQESGGGTFSSGHGDKKKRKKKKYTALKSKANDNKTKRKRGRPRKHRVEDDEEMTTGSDHRKQADDTMEEDGFSENENQFSGSEDYDDESDDDEDEDDEESEDEVPYRSRSREMEEEEEDGELDEGMHSDEEKPSPDEKKAKAEKDEPPTPVPEKAETTTNHPSNEPKQALSTSTAPSPEDEEMRKKLKLLKLKKKLEKTQQLEKFNDGENSAASKIQIQWKKKKGKTLTLVSNEKESTSTSAVVTTDSTTAPMVTESKTTIASSSVFQEKAPSSTGELESTTKKESEYYAPKASSAASDSKPTKETEKPKPVDSQDAKVESKKSKNENPSEKSSSSNAAAGDRGKDDEKKEKPKKKNGFVKAPTREVKDWMERMSVKKARKSIRVGMRVKVRFQIPVAGKKTKRKFYGGKVVKISKLKDKIRIKYDDGTSEVTEFPDKDVYVDAVNNGEHAVSADRFIPPPYEEEEEEEMPPPAAATEKAPEALPAPAPVEEQEEGEIPTPKNSSATSVVAMETEEGEVEEETKAKTARPVETPEAKPTPKESSEDVPPPPPEEETADLLMEKPSTSPPVVSKSESADAIEISKEDVRVEPSPSPSQEEGELSPGITVSKSAENLLEESIAVVPDSTPLPAKALMSSNLGSEEPTTEPIKFAEESTFEKAKPVPKNPEGEDKCEEKSEAPAKPKKLSIRIPSNSLATIKNLSSPGSSKSPKPTPTNTPAAQSEVDDVLKDTPETKKEITTKRKRVEEDATPVVEDASEPPAKRRIKVAIGKTILDAGATNPPADEEAAKEVAVDMEAVAPIAEESISSAETKKKKKKGDRVKSPRPKSPMAVPEAVKSKTAEDPAAAAVTPKQQKIGSKESAFSAKKKDDSTAAEDLLTGAGSLRTGRKAAEEAKEKLSVKQKAKLSAKEPKEAGALELGKKSKKKRRREKEAEEQGEEFEEVEPSELEWVQCDKCKKWRVLPDNVKAASLPDLWYCQMNVYDPKRSKCEAPEQNMKQVQRERKKKARKKAKREAESAESQQERPTKKSKQVEEDPPKKKSKQEKLQAGAGTPRSVSPKPGKSAKSESKKAIAEAKREKTEGGKKSKGVDEGQSQVDSGSDTQKEVKKKGKKGKKEPQDSTDNQDAEDPKKGGRKRGRPSRNQTACTPVPTSATNAGEDEDNVEWVQCDKCEKWRKLPPHISADELPDIWNCSMNTWNPSNASCDAEEDKADAYHQEVGATEWQLRQTHAGKYSYRQMIFGTGARKHNRPMSERARAAESLFRQAVVNDEQPYPTTQYTKSSAFLPRQSNFDKRNAVVENTLSIIDVLRQSNLWEDLRTMDMKPTKVLSSSASTWNIPGQKLKTFDSLQDEIKHAMQDVVLQTLEFGCLTADEITGKAQWFPYETSIKGVAGIRGYCNEDIIVHTLLDLVRDGLVEMATVTDPYLPVSQWVPRYRRVGTKRANEAIEAIQASRCMKIAKPWKQRPSKSTTTTEWVTGRKVN